eukprot:354782-Chlamydomonas_euryale.AAC.10
MPLNGACCGMPGAGSCPCMPGAGSCPLHAGLILPLTGRHVHQEHANRVEAATEVPLHARGGASGGTRHLPYHHRRQPRAAADPGIRGGLCSITATTTTTTTITPSANAWRLWGWYLCFQCLTESLKPAGNLYSQRSSLHRLVRTWIKARSGERRKQCPNPNAGHEGPGRDAARARGQGHQEADAHPDSGPARCALGTRHDWHRIHGVWQDARVRSPDDLDCAAGTCVRAQAPAPQVTFPPPQSIHSALPCFRALPYP